MTESSGFSRFSDLARPFLRDELERAVSSTADYGASGLMDIITYQLGWSGDLAGPKAEGKQIRPLLVLLAAEAGGGDWKKALPAAAAVELIHNFSLIHDDIEDRGEQRRGRPTVWKVWGEAQAINAGDAMFSLASLALSRTWKKPWENPPPCGRSTYFTPWRLRLTQGQYLDIKFEDQDQVEMDHYWQMVGGKTAALLAFSLEAGALCAGLDQEVQGKYRDFGHYLGLSFQVQDDILGIWGNEELIGKSSTGDLVVHKKTLPVLYGLEQKKAFYQAWHAGPITAEAALEMAKILEFEGALAYAQKTADRMTRPGTQFPGRSQSPWSGGRNPPGINPDTAELQILSISFPKLPLFSPPEGVLSPPFPFTFHPSSFWYNCRSLND